MAISYRKLFNLMDKCGVKKVDLRTKYGINPKTVDRLTKNESVTVDTLMMLCEIFNVQPGDILEYVPGPASDNE